MLQEPPESCLSYSAKMTPDQAALAALALFVMQQHIIGMPGAIIIIGMPAFIMVIICSQAAMNMPFIDISIGIISQVIPLAVIVQVIRHMIAGIIDPAIIGIMPPVMQHIVMPPHEAVIGMPHAIIADICWQQAMKVSLMAGSIAVISHFMPVAVIAQVIRAIMQLAGMPWPIIGIMPPMPGIIAPIMGIIAIVVFISVCSAIRGRPARPNSLKAELPISLS